MWLHKPTEKIIIEKKIDWVPILTLISIITQVIGVAISCKLIHQDAVYVVTKK